MICDGFIGRLMEIANAALAQPCPSGMTQSIEFEYLAEIAKMLNMPADNGDAILERIREKVAGSEDTQLLDWLENHPMTGIWHSEKGWALHATSRSDYPKIWFPSMREVVRAAIESGKE